MDFSQGFFPRKQSLAPDADEAARQQMMELCLQDLVEYCKKTDSPRVIDRMGMEYVSCAEAEQCLTMGFPTADWQLNPGNTMHGGMIATAIDTAMGLAVHYFSGQRFNPTISMNLNYLKPVLLGDTLDVTAQITNLGRRVCFVTATGRRRSDGKTAVTAQGSFVIQ